MTNTARMPVIYLSHGGGPCFWMEFPPPFGAHAFDKLRDHLTGLLSTLPARPKAILMVSAHWEEDIPTLGGAKKPEMIYDYYGFPEETYALSYPAPGAPDLATHIQDTLAKSGLASAIDQTRGFDHGVFVPMMMIDPSAQIPVIPLSLKHNLSASEHIALGRALAPLRNEGILILGSGNSYHNLRQFFDGREGVSPAFDQWLTNAVTVLAPQERNKALSNWVEAPDARACHPREEHLLPLMVIAGAAEEDIGRLSFHDAPGKKHISGYTFG